MTHENIPREDMNATEPMKLIAKALGSMDKRIERIDETMRHLQQERQRIEKQRLWLVGFTYDVSNDVYKRREGETVYVIMREIVEANRTAWPFIDLWYRVHPNEQRIP